MKETLNMTRLFDRLEDLKSLFQIGQQVVPMLKNLIGFMNDTVPLLETINLSIAESTSKIPKATMQLNSVTSATELATTEILDFTDEISTKVDSVKNLLIEKMLKDEKRNEELEKIFSAITDENLLIQIEEYKKHYIKDTILENVIDELTAISSIAYNITMALQIQDITAQQLAAVNHLIQSVQIKLAELISDFEKADIKENALTGIEVPDGATFDPNASYTKSSEKQDMADSLVKESVFASQDEIDKLFCK